MASLRQIDASRTNGARSKGPVTPEGKAKVSQNGTTHGIYAQVIVLANENESLYFESKDSHLQEWNPLTPTEYNLVMDIVDARWRLRRFSTLETAAINFELERMRAEVEQVFTQIDEPTRTVLAFNALITNNRTFEVLQSAARHQHRIVDRATSQLLRLRKDRPGDDSNSGKHTSTCPADTTAAEPQPATANRRTKPEPASQTVDTARPDRFTIVSNTTKSSFSPRSDRSLPPPLTRATAA